jgi:protein-S-isoprenylcysteine O-methyltransferase Ste14
VTPLPYANGGAKLAFDFVLVAFMLGELLIRARSRLNRQGSRADRGSYAVVYVTVVVGLLAGFALAAGAHGAAIRQARWPVFVIGVVLMAVGFVIRQWAVLLLGRFFTVNVRVHADQVVVDQGPYRWVRHPSYTGMVITFVGIGLALGNWATLATMVVVPLVGLVYRIRVEERALLDGIGDPYRRFAEGRARLIPHVW